MKVILIFLMLVSYIYADRDGGPYVGFGYGSSKFSDDDLYKSLKEDTSMAMILYAGAYINKHLSIEAGYTDLNLKNEYRAIDELNTLKDVSFTAINVSTLAHYAFFDDILDFYAKFGVGRASMSGGNGSGFDMLFGAGMGVRFSELFSAKVAYDRHVLKYDEMLKDYDMHIDFAYVAFEVQF
ncbi:MAG: porin family protein [Epsilonproteobacteria bacterium]|nr:porin family protein [Campylobacterota bacterium]